MVYISNRSSFRHLAPFSKSENKLLFLFPTLQPTSLLLSGCSGATVADFKELVDKAVSVNTVPVHWTEMQLQDVEWMLIFR